MGLVLIVVFLTVLVLGLGLALRAHIGEGLPERELLRRRTAGLTMQDRRRVYRAVQKGRAVVDPSLAAAAVARARYGRAYGRRFTRGPWRWLFPVCAVTQFAAAGERLLSPSMNGFLRWTGGAASLLLGVLFASMPWQLRFYQRRADRAEQLNLGLLYLQQQERQQR